KDEAGTVSDILHETGEPVSLGDHLIEVLVRTAESRTSPPVVDHEGRLKGLVNKAMLLKAVAGEGS
ncbi:MAG: hypothetical protein ACOCVM_03140, partial [Desulfovibrionaceae bacterium]